MSPNDIFDAVGAPKFAAPYPSASPYRLSITVPSRPQPVVCGALGPKRTVMRQPHWWPDACGALPVAAAALEPAPTREKQVLKFSQTACAGRSRCVPVNWEEEWRTWPRRCCGSSNAVVTT
jgi:hypothetical protein